MKPLLGTLSVSLMLATGGCRLVDASFGKSCAIDDDCHLDPLDADLVCRSGRCLTPEVIDVVATGERCSEAIPLSVPGTVQGSTAGALNDHADVCAGGEAPDRAYVVTLSARSNLIVTLQVDGFDGALYASDAPGCVTTLPASCTDTPVENDATEVMRLSGVGPGDVYIVVDGADGVIAAGAGGGYTLAVELEANCDGGFAVVGDRCVGILGEVNAVVDRTNAAAVLLDDGRVLLTGGRSGAGLEPTATAELYDPATNRFTATGSMAVPRARHAIARLDTGDVLVLGGVIDTDGTPTASVERYNVASGTFSAAPSLPRRRDLLTATTLGDGRVVVIGGRDGGNTLDDVLVIDRTLAGWARTGVLAQPRFGHVALLPEDSQTIYAIGGRFGPDSEALDSVELVTASSVAVGPAMDDARGGAAGAVLEDGDLLIVSGFTGSLADEVAAIPRCATLRPGDDGWLDTDGALSIPRLFGTANGIPGVGVVVAGGGLDAPTAAVELYLERERTFVPLPPLRHPRLAHTTVALRDGRLLVMAGDGGDENRTVPLRAAELIGVAP